MNLWCTVVKPYEMSPRAVPSSLKWPFRIYQAGYGGYPDASTTCWAARRLVTEDVAHISEATGDLSYKSHTHQWATQAHTQTSEMKTPWTHTLQRPWAMNWISLTHKYTLQRPKWEVVSHTYSQIQIRSNTSETMTGHLNTLSHTHLQPTQETMSEDLKNLYPDSWYTITHDLVSCL